MNNKLRHLITQAIVFTLITTTRAIGYTNNIKPQIEQYATKNLTILMEQHEAEFCINYGTAPNVAVHFRTDGAANYSFYNRTITFDSYDFFKISPAVNPYNILSFDIMLNESQVKETLDHELGHHYTAEQAQNIGSLVFERSYIFTLSGQDALANRALLEGIAVYFEKELGSDNEYLSDDEYKWGYKLVKPILDRYGVQNGVTYLLLNPPIFDDLTTEESVLNYQGRLTDKMESDNVPLNSCVP